jgi:hypothetical protein
MGVHMRLPLPSFHADPARVTRAAAIAIFMLLPGCAEMQWTKPGMSSAALDQDLLQCSQRARLEARREEIPRIEAPLVLRSDPLGQPVVVPSSTRGSDRFLLEHDFTSACMRGKGYELSRVDGKK